MKAFFIFAHGGCWGAEGLRVFPSIVQTSSREFTNNKLDYTCPTEISFIIKDFKTLKIKCHKVHHCSSFKLDRSFTNSQNPTSIHKNCIYVLCIELTIIILIQWLLTNPWKSETNYYHILKQRLGKDLHYFLGSFHVK